MSCSEDRRTRCRHLKGKTTANEHFGRCKCFVSLTRTFYTFRATLSLRHDEILVGSTLYLWALGLSAANLASTALTGLARSEVPRLVVLRMGKTCLLSLEAINKRAAPTHLICDTLVGASRADELGHERRTRGTALARPIKLMLW